MAPRRRTAAGVAVAALFACWCAAAVATAADAGGDGDAAAQDCEPGSAGCGADGRAAHSYTAEANSPDADGGSDGATGKAAEGGAPDEDYYGDYEDYYGSAMDSHQAADGEGDYYGDGGGREGGGRGGHGDDAEDDYGEGDDEDDEWEGGDDEDECRGVDAALRTRGRRRGINTVEEVLAAAEERCPKSGAVLRTATLKLVMGMNATFWEADALMRRGLARLEARLAACKDEPCAGLARKDLNKTREHHIGLIAHSAKMLFDNREGLADVATAHNITVYGLRTYPVSQVLRAGAYACLEAADEYPVEGSGELTDAAVFSASGEGRPDGARVVDDRIGLTVIDGFLSDAEAAELAEHAARVSDIRWEGPAAPHWCFGNEELLQAGVKAVLARHGIPHEDFFTAAELDASATSGDPPTVAADGVTGPLGNCLRRNRSEALGDAVAAHGGSVVSAVPVQALAGSDEDDEGYHPVLRALSERVERVLGLPDAHGQGWQLTRYPAGAEYTEHTDCDDGDGDGNEDEDEEESGSTGLKLDRLATVLVYLTTPEDGGETRFGAVGAAVEPKAGRVVVWKNLDDEGRCNPDTRHAAVPASGGVVKAIAQRWYHKNAQNSMHLTLEPPEIDEYVPGATNIVCDQGDATKCRYYAGAWTFY